MNFQEYAIAARGGEAVQENMEFFRGLGWFAQIHDALLADVRRTLAREAAGFELVYGVDFNVIYSYANPWSRECHHARCVDFLIEHDDARLTLLPGTVEEIHQYLQRNSALQAEGRGLIERLRRKDARSETINAAKNLVRRMQFSDEDGAKQLELTLLAQQLIELQTRWSVSRSRIERFLTLPRLVELQAIFPADTIQTYKVPAKEKIMARVAAQPNRSERLAQNEADAKNLATICCHAEQEWQAKERNPQHRGTLLRLLTSTPALCSRDLVDHDLYRDPAERHSRQASDYFEFENVAVRHSLAVRMPIEAVYERVLKRSCGDSPRAAARQAQSFLRKNREFLSSIEAEMQRIDDNAKLTTAPLSTDPEERLSAQFLSLRSQPDDSSARMVKYAEEFLQEPWLHAIHDLFLIDHAETLQKQGSVLIEDPWGPERGIGLRRDPQAFDRARIVPVALLEPLEQAGKDQMKPLRLLGIEGRWTRIAEGKASRFTVTQRDGLALRDVAVIECYETKTIGSWPGELSPNLVIDVVNSLYAGAGPWAGCKAGELRYYFGSDKELNEQIVTQLPLSRSLHMEDHFKTIRSRADEHGEWEVPGQIVCESERAYIRFDMLPPTISHSAGVMMAVKRGVHHHEMMGVFAKTSKWGGTSVVGKRLRSLLLKELRCYEQSNPTTML